MALTDRRILYRAALAAAIGSALVLAGCGRNGPLEAPGGAAVDKSTADKNAASTVGGGTSSDSTTTGDTKKTQKPDRPFLLDFLI